jgi:hypothetical protein
MTPTPSLFAQTTRYAQTTAPLATSSSTSLPIPGLIIMLPAATAAEKEAVITLNMPNVFLEGTPVGGTRGGEVSVFVGATSVAAAQISDDNTALPGDGRKATTIVVKVPLRSAPQRVQAEWNGVRATTIHTDTFASLSAILTTN